MALLKYIASYSQELQDVVQQMIEADQLAAFLKDRHPTFHEVRNDHALRDFTLEIKNRFLKKSDPISKVVYDNKLHAIHNALGTHRFVTRAQGHKLKSKHEIRIASVFKNAPEAFLRMIVVHELAHLKEKEHNKAFYHLCEHMQPDYHQVEFELRLFLTQQELLATHT